MATVAELIEAIHDAPRGPRIAACFDYDGTVIDGFSAAFSTPAQSSTAINTKTFFIGFPSLNECRRL